MFRKNNIRILILVLFFLIFFNETNGQCSMCRAALQSSDSHETAKGINNGIIYLMSIPYLLVGFVGWKIFKMIKNK